MEIRNPKTNSIERVHILFISVNRWKIYYKGISTEDKPEYIIENEDSIIRQGQESMETTTIIKKVKGKKWREPKEESLK